MTNLMCVIGVNVWVFFCLIPYLFSDAAFGGEAGTVLVFDPLHVQAKPIPAASVYAR